MHCVIIAFVPGIVLMEWNRSHGADRSPGLDLFSWGFQPLRNLFFHFFLRSDIFLLLSWIETYAPPSGGTMSPSLLPVKTQVWITNVSNMFSGIAARNHSRSGDAIFTRLQRTQETRQGGKTKTHRATGPENWRLLGCDVVVWRLFTFCKHHLMLK